MKEMGVFIFFFTLTTMFSLTYCYQRSFEFDLPGAINTLTNATTQLFVRAMDMVPESEVPSLADSFEKLKWNLVGYMATILTSLRRVEEMRPNVELGPGVFKTDIIKYPENFYVNRLKTLLKIKKKEEELNKPLN